MSIADALESPGRLQKVEGALMAEDGVPRRLCSALGRGTPPSCVEPSLELDGIRDLSAFDNIRSAGGTSWIEDATVAGRVERQTLRFEMTCRTRDVRRHFEERTGHELSINFFQTTADVERLDAGPLPELIPAEVRGEYGWFGIAVRSVPARGEPPLFARTLRDAIPGTHGVAWLREDKSWIAYKRYGDDVVLLWVRVGARRLDERWHRLDRVLRDLPGTSA